MSINYVYRTHYAATHDCTGYFCVLCDTDIERRSLCDVSVANENVSLVISRQILTEFCSYFSSLPDAVGKEVAHFTLDKVQPRVVSFEEQVELRYVQTPLLTFLRNFPIDGNLPTCCGLVSDTANKSATSRCNGIWKMT